MKVAVRTYISTVLSTGASEARQCRNLLTAVSLAQFIQLNVSHNRSYEMGRWLAKGSHPIARPISELCTTGGRGVKPVKGTSSSRKPCRAAGVEIVALRGAGADLEYMSADCRGEFCSGVWLYHCSRLVLAPKLLRVLRALLVRAWRGGLDLVRRAEGVRLILT